MKVATPVHGLQRMALLTGVFFNETALKLQSVHNVTNVFLTTLEMLVEDSWWRADVQTADRQGTGCTPVSAASKPDASFAPHCCLPVPLMLQVGLKFGFDSTSLSHILTLHQHTLTF